MTSLKANIFAIGRHRFDVDGTGVRSLVVFAGCPLRCKYCINPYTWDGSKKAVAYTPEMLLQKVSVDSVYFQATNGGITFGGGEPLLHSRFISDFIDIAPTTWNYTVETSLSVPFENVEQVINKISHFVVDIKTLDEDKYYSYTNNHLDLAKQNLISLLKIVGKERITVRVPTIPGYVNIDSQNKTIAELRAIGIDCTVEVPAQVDWGGQMAYLIGWGSPFDADDHTYKVFGTDKGANYSGYSNALVDQYLTEARKSADEAVRAENYDKFQEALANDPAYAFICYVDADYVAKTNVKGIAPNTVMGHHGVGIFWNVTEWTIGE